MAAYQTGLRQNVDVVVFVLISKRSEQVDQVVLSLAAVALPSDEHLFVSKIKHGEN